jgi:hypothetical protein
MELLPAELASRFDAYCRATEHTYEQATRRLLEIGLRTWETLPEYKPERVCGRVRTTVRH